MAVTETTTTSWGTRLGNSVKGVLVGLALFVAGFPILFWNEGNTVKTRKALEEGQEACVSVESNADVDGDYEGMLVHMSGLADTKDVLSDAQFGVSGAAIRLTRTVEMYQWQETSRTSKRKKLGGGEEEVTTYSHKKVWSSMTLDSPSHPEGSEPMVNPGSFEFESASEEAENVTFGAFTLSKSQIASIHGEKPYDFPTNWICAVARTVRNGKWIYVPNSATRLNELNNRDVISEPRIGDMRVKFTVVKPHDVSIVAKQHGDTFVPYVAKNGKKVQLLADGVKDAAEMFEDAQSANSTMCWLIRLGGFLLMLIGLNMVFKPLSVLADVLPILGDIVGLGTGLVAFVIALVCALVTIAVAWLFYRPVLGVALLAAAAALICWLRSKRAAKAAAANPAV